MNVVGSFREDSRHSTTSHKKFTKSPLPSSGIVLIVGLGMLKCELGVTKFQLSGQLFPVAALTVRAIVSVFQVQSNRFT